MTLVACSTCGRGTRKPAKGLCPSCYTQNWRAENGRKPHANRAAVAKRAYEKARADPVRVEAIRDKARRRYANLTPEQKRIELSKVKNDRVKRLYGIDVRTRDALLRAQGGCCALCARETSFVGASRMYGAHIDHCHATGRVRGILCGGCNTTLGKLGDSVERIEGVLRYLRGAEGIKGRKAA